MDVLILLVFISLTLATCGVTFFVWTVRSGSNEHSDRLALLPLEGDASRPPSVGTSKETP